MMLNQIAALLLLSRSTLLLFPFLKIVLGNLVLFSILAIISQISFARLWFSGWCRIPPFAGLRMRSVVQHLRDV